MRPSFFLLTATKLVRFKPNDLETTRQNLLLSRLKRSLINLESTFRAFSVFSFSMQKFRRPLSSKKKITVFKNLLTIY